MCNPLDPDRAYANSAFIPGSEALPALWAQKAASFRAQLEGRARLALPYGPLPRNRFDLFLPETTPYGLMVFVHGGYWMETSRNLWSHLAAGATARGWACALPSYTLAPEARISQITAEVDAAIAAACFAEGSSKSLVTERLIRRGGLLDLLGTSDLREVERRADAGDERAVLIRRAMIYAVAKQIGAMAVACGRPALIVISGGMARSKRFVQEIVERVEFLAPVEVFPGEQETTALVLGALRVMRGEEPARRYEPWKA